MATTIITAAPIKLEPLAGPSVPPITITTDRPFRLGRHSTCDASLPDQTVSRAHCLIEFRAGSWLVSDLESRHGTYLNGSRLNAAEPTPIREGDLLRLGPWTFRVATKESTGGKFQTTTTEEEEVTGVRVQKIPAAELSIRAQHRLELLLDCAASITAATTEETLATAVLDALISGTNFPRAAFIRHLGGGEQIQILGYRGPAREPQSSFVVSRSLLQAAADGAVVRLDSASGLNYGQSVIQLGIQAAICAPVMVGASPVAFLYLDARNHERAAEVEPDAAAFCQAVARLSGLALSNLGRADLKKRAESLEADLRAAREAQRVIMPPTHGERGRLIYAMHSRPGRFVAGDLFDVITLPDGRVAVFLGDVAGKGIGAAILMATAQAHLHAHLVNNANPVAAVKAVNEYISDRSVEAKFISLWLGLFDPANAVLTFVDAGHGHWLVRHPGGSPDRVACSGGLPLGVDASYVFQAEEVRLERGSRVIIYSDGVVEQRSPTGEEFGLAKAVEALAPSESPDGDVTALFHAVRRYAAPSAAPELDIALADDVTVASIQLR